MAQAWLSIKVIGDERVTVPAGVIDTYVIKASPEISPEELKKAAPHGITFVRSKSYVM